MISLLIPWPGQYQFFHVACPFVSVQHWTTGFAWEQDCNLFSIVGYHSHCQTSIVTFWGGIVIIIALARISANSNSIHPHLCSCMEEGLSLLCFKLRFTTYQLTWESTITIKNNCHSFTKTILETGTITRNYCCWVFLFFFKLPGTYRYEVELQSHPIPLIQKLLPRGCPNVARNRTKS